MLEKIGLPEKPSMRGNNWVVDASHCQGCSSNFTFINRKHHCRRCGGLFCGTCTQQRMVLRGQGDSPVRICDPCKKLEEAARFELRHGIKKKAGRGGSKLTSPNEDEVLDQILGNERKEATSLRSSASGSSSSSILQDYDEDERNNASPEELRQQAVEEKNKYKTLKAQGKPDEALKAFKRGKELERQAGALEIQLRKNRRKTSSLVNTAEIQKTDDSAASSSGRKNESSLRKSKDKDDISSELKDLGWSDLDLHDAEKKPAPMSLEGELVSLLGEVSQKTGTEKTSLGIDKTQVLALKKQALAFKREGKLGEAKEKLKEAKILEKKLEEQEFLGDDEESDDELSALIRSMDNGKHDDVAVGFESGPGLNFDQLLNADIDENFEVTDDDMYDPDMDAVLKSLGWDDNESDLNQKRAGDTLETTDLQKKAKVLEKAGGTSAKSAPKSRAMIQKELLGIKKRALALRREGKTSEADEELSKGKVLEQQLEEIDNGPKVNDSRNKHDESITLPDIGDEVEADVSDKDMHDPAYLGLLKNLGWDEEEEDDKNAPRPQAVSAVPRRSKAEIQRELLGLKRKALASRRQGKNEEAEEALEMAKVLEAQLEEMDVPKKETKPETQNHSEDASRNDKILLEKKEVSRNDKIPLEKKEVSRNENPGIDKPDTVQSSVSNNTQTSIKQQILALKRNALALKREGKIAEAKEELLKAKQLEKTSEENSSISSEPTSTVSNVNLDQTNEKKSSPSSSSGSKPLSSRDRFKLQQESLGLKRLSRKLRMEGRNEEADAEFEKAKAIEAQLEESSGDSSASGSKPPVDDVAVEDFLDPQLMSALKALGIDDSSSTKTQNDQKVELPKKPVTVKKAENSGNERAILEEQIKAEKIKAMTLKRAGKQAEALDSLRRAKMLEKKLNSVSS